MSRDITVKSERIGQSRGTGVLNDSVKGFRFVEFQVGEPYEPDIVQVEW